jgi:hypothetical protein
LKNQTSKIEHQNGKLKSSKFWILILGLSLLAGCGDMKDNTRYKPYEESSMFKDGQLARPAIENTVPRGFLNEDEHLYAGKIDGKPADSFPFPITKEVLLRGKQRYTIYCSVCHDQLGTGHGVVVRRGFKTPPSFHIDRLRNSPDGYFFDVITKGYGNMPDYAAQIMPEDRWAIVAYLRALQLSQHASASDLSEAEQQNLEHLMKAPQTLPSEHVKPAKH